MSPRPLIEPKRPPDRSSGGWLALNLEPIAHFSSASAGLASPSCVGVEKPEPRLRMGGASGSTGKRGGARWDLQFSLLSGTVSLFSDPSPSYRRRVLVSRSRRPRSGSGPSRRHEPANFSSSAWPWAPGRSLAFKLVRKGSRSEIRSRTRFSDVYSDCTV